MLNVAPHVTPGVAPGAPELAVVVCEHLDELATFATHLVGDPNEAMEFVAAGVQHATRYPPARLRVDGRVALFRAVLRACRQQQRLGGRGHGPGRLLRRHRPLLRLEVDATAAQRMNTVKRALATLQLDRRAALLLRDLVKLSYAEMARVMECSPEAASRLLAAARRDFGNVYREIAL